MAQSRGWLDDEVALITGGGSGLGLALVERFLDEGARVAVLERSAEKVAALRERFDAQRVVAVQGDVTSYADNERAVSAAVEAFGKLDTFVGNAAIWDHASSLVDLTPEQLDSGYDELFSINVKG